jgi:hypothetical protein
VSYLTQRRSRLAETGARSAPAGASHPSSCRTPPAWYAGARVEARAATEHVEELRRALEKLAGLLGELRGGVPSGVPAAPRKVVLLT